METWAAFLLKEEWENSGAHGIASSISIRASKAYYMLRQQLCFNDATDYEIRQTVMKHSKKIDFSFKREDYAPWPPWKCKVSASTWNWLERYCGGKTKEEYQKEQEAIKKREWFEDNPGDLPPQEVYEKTLWDERVKTWEEEGLPIPPFFATCKLRLLSPNRLGKAAQELFFTCPLCRKNESGRKEWPGSWFIPENEFFNELNVCIKCNDIIMDLRWETENQEKEKIRKGRIDIPRKFSQDAAQQALKELGIIVTKELASQTIRQIFSGKGGKCNVIS